MNTEPMFCVFCERRPASFVLCRRGVDAAAGVCEGCRVGLDQLVALLGTDLREWLLVSLATHSPAVPTLQEEQQAAVLAAEALVAGAQRHV